MDTQELFSRLERYWGYLAAIGAGIALVWRYGYRTMVSVVRALRLSNGLHSHYGNRDVAQKIIADIRDRHKQIATNRTRLELLESRVDLAIYITDSEGRCTDANEELCELFGLERSHFSGVGWSEAVHPKDRIAVVDLWQKSVEKRIAYDAEYTVVNRRNLLTFEVATRAEPVICCTGELLGYVGVVWKITKENT